MATPIRIKRSAEPNKRPTLTDLQLGEPAVNTYDGRIYLKRDTGVASTIALVTPWIENVGGSIYYNDGNIGIGTINPMSKFSVVGNGLFTGNVNASTFSGQINAGVTTVSSLSIGSTQVVSSGRQLQNILSLDSITATTIESVISNSPNSFTDLTVTGISTLGITSITQLTTQSINSSGIITGLTFRPSTGYIQASDGTNSFYIYSGTGNVAFQGTIGASQINSASGYKALDFGTTATPSVNITNSLNVGAGGTVITTTASGRLGIGTTNPAQVLDVIGNINASGTVTANSDRSLKENIRTIPDALEKVMSLRGVEYDRIDNGDHQIGVIAQEVQAIVPEVVYGDEIKSVAYANLVGLLIEAIKELKNEIEELKK